MLKMAVLAPIPSASISTVSSANPGLLASWRKPKRTSWRNSASHSARRTERFRRFAMFMHSASIAW
jgi:hypothetical protein